MGIALVITMAAVITMVDQPIQEALQGDHVIAVGAELGANLR
jgi:hypothetical protein